MDDSSSMSDLFTENMELNITKHLEGQEALDWLQENHPEVYDTINGTFEDGRCFLNRDYWKINLFVRRIKRKFGNLYG